MSYIPAHRCFSRPASLLASVPLLFFFFVLLVFPISSLLASRLRRSSFPRLSSRSPFGLLCASALVFAPRRLSACFHVDYIFFASMSLGHHTTFSFHNKDVSLACFFSSCAPVVAHYFPELLQKVFLFPGLFLSQSSQTEQSAAMWRYQPHTDTFRRLVVRDTAPHRVSKQGCLHFGLNSLRAASRCISRLRRTMHVLPVRQLWALAPEQDGPSSLRGPVVRRHDHLAPPCSEQGCLYFGPCLQSLRAQAWYLEDTFFHTQLMPDFGAGYPADNSDGWSPEATEEIEYLDHWLKTPVHFLPGGFTNSKPLR